MIDERNFLDQPVKNDIRTYNNIPKIALRQGDVVQLVARLSLFKK